MSRSELAPADASDGLEQPLERFRSEIDAMVARSHKRSDKGLSRVDDPEVVVDHRGLPWFEVHVASRNGPTAKRDVYAISVPVSLGSSAAAVVRPRHETRTTMTPSQVARAVSSIPSIQHVEIEFPATTVIPERRVGLPRIMGIEQEYDPSVSLTRRDDNGIVPPYINKQGRFDSSVFENSIAMNAAPGTVVDGSEFTMNGGRLYPDGFHPEYATPECLSAVELTAADAAGSEIMFRVAEGMSSYLSAVHGDGIRVEYLKHNAEIGTDPRGGTLWASSRTLWGTHENYEVAVDLSSAHMGVELIPFLATRPLLVGAGGVGLAPGRVGGTELAFVRAPRSHATRKVFDSDGGPHPFIMTRDEPHATSSAKRLQIPYADGNRTQFGTWLKVGSTHLVLRLLEERAGFARPVDLDSPLRVVQDVAGAIRSVHHPDWKASVALADGRSMQALDVQEFYADSALDLLSSEGGEPWEHDVAGAWRSLIDEVRHGRMSATTKVEWMLKAHLVGRHIERHGVTLGSTSTADFLRAFVSCDPERSMIARLEQRGRIPVIADRDLIALRTVEAPADTRAAVRADLLRYASSRGVAMVADWDRVGIALQSAEQPNRAWLSLFLDSPRQIAPVGLDEFYDAIDARATLARTELGSGA